MAFSSELANLVASQLRRFESVNPHQLAGHAENLEFWVAQVENALRGLDEYGVRFVRMQAAQERYVARHGTVEFTVGGPGRTEHSPTPPRRVPERELRTARASLVEATKRFLKRCLKAGVIAEERFADTWTQLRLTE